MSKSTSADWDEPPHGPELREPEIRGRIAEMPLSGTRYRIASDGSYRKISD